MRNDIWTPKSGPNPLCFINILTWKCASRHNGCTFSTAQLSNMFRNWGGLYILTWKCASRHNGVHFLDIATSKSGPSMVCFVHFDLEMCFAPQRRALFRHLNFQKCSEAEVFCTFWLRNVLSATTACNFSSLIWPAGSAPAALASLLFDPPEPQIIGKTQCFATFLPFRAPGSSFFWNFRFLIFFLLLFFSLTLPISAFHLPILSEVWLLNFLRQYSIDIYVPFQPIPANMQHIDLHELTLHRKTVRPTHTYIYIHFLHILYILDLFYIIYII